MQDKLLQTPDGVRDTYDVECKKKRKVMHELHHILELYSYHDIETPTFEFFDIFNRDKGSAPSNEMYKFFDRDNNTLVLRPDITPSIARCVAKYYADEELPDKCNCGLSLCSGDSDLGHVIAWIAEEPSGSKSHGLSYIIYNNIRNVHVVVLLL